MTQISEKSGPSQGGPGHRQENTAPPPHLGLDNVHVQNIKISYTKWEDKCRFHRMLLHNYNNYILLLNVLGNMSNSPFFVLMTFCEADFMPFFPRNS
jgi:hypothetical protein